MTEAGSEGSLLFRLSASDSSVFTRSLDLDLDLDSARIQLDRGHVGPHSDAIRVCQELPSLLPPR